MKKGIYLLLLVVFLLVVSGCGKKHEVKFVSGDSVITITVKDGEKVEELSHGTYADHEFLGWYDGEELYDFNKEVNKDLVLTAKWEIIKYTITFKSDDGSVIDEQILEINSKITAPTNVVKKSDDNYDYTFTRWDKDFDTATSDLTITAVFTATTRKYDVTFYNEDGEEIKVDKVQKGTKATFLDLKKADDAMYTYKLKNWKLKNGEKFDFSTLITSDVKLYPDFERIPVYASLSGKTISIMGDSVSTFYKDGDANNSYYHGDNEFYYPRYCSAISDSSKTWWMLTINGLGAKLGVNNSLSGSSVTGSTSKAGQSSERINTLGEKGNPDIILCFLGINDNVNGMTKDQYKQAYKNMLSKMIAKYPSAYIFVCTLPYSGYHTTASHYYYEETDRVAYNEVLHELADEYKIGLIDFASAITKDNYNKNYNDNLHYNVAGMNTMSKQAILDITKYFNQGRAMYALDFVIESDDITVSEELYSYYEDEEIVLPTASKEGFEFKGWYLDSEFESEVVTNTKGYNEDLRLYPKFIPTLNEGEFYIEYKLNGGTLVVIDIEETEKEFCEEFEPFACEFFGKELEIDDITDLGFTKYEDGTWGFVKNSEGTGTDWGKLYYAQASDTSGYAICKFFKENYAKWGWLLEYISACAINNSSLMNVDSSWPEPIVIELCGFFNQQQVEWSGTHSTAPYGSEEELNADIYDYYPSVNPVQSGTYTLPIPTYDGYTFKGWYLNKDFTGEAVTEVSTSVKVYAKWEENN